MAEFNGRHSAKKDSSSRVTRDVPSLSANDTSQKSEDTSRRPAAGSSRIDDSPYKSISTARSTKQYRSSNSSLRSRKDQGARKPVNYIGYGLGGGKRKSQPVKSIIVSAIAIVVLGLLIFGGYKLVQSLGVFGEKPPVAVTQVDVFIPEGSTTSEIAKQLRKKGVISKESSFINAVVARGVESRLQPGQYSFTTGMTDDAVIDILLDGPISYPSVDGNTLTIPEGYTLRMIAQRVQDTCGIPKQKFIEEANNAEKYLADYPFLECLFTNPDVPASYRSLEGFLYPKTYLIPKEADAEYIVRTMLTQFSIEIKSLDMTYANSRNLDLFDVLKIASMIEKETAQESEKPLVSSVIYNRLRLPMKLQFCSTVYYSIGIDNWGEHELTQSDLVFDSPYNTYVYYGMPLGPICSPHISTIIAAANPAQTKYLYFVLTAKGMNTHTFCETEAEFWIAEKKYQESLKN